MGTSHPKRKGKDNGWMDKQGCVVARLRLLLNVKFHFSKVSGFVHNDYYFM